MATDLVEAWSNVRRHLERLAALAPELARELRQHIARDASGGAPWPARCVASTCMVDPLGRLVRLPLAERGTPEAQYGSLIASGWRWATADETRGLQRDRTGGDHEDVT